MKVLDKIDLYILGYKILRKHNTYIIYILHFTSKFFLCMHCHYCQRDSELQLCKEKFKN